MGHVDDFLLQQIFVRLPAKSVHRFKCVSRHWLSLISDTYFAHQYVQFQLSRADVDEADAYKNLGKTTFIYMETSARIPRCLDFPSSDAFEFEGFSFEFIPAKFQQFRLKLLASSHGWILCSSENSNSSAASVTGWQIDYHLCSPLSKQWIDIPRPPKPENLIDRNIDEKCLVGLIFEDDDLISSFSSISNNGSPGKSIQFKVVIIFSFVIFIALIFSSESWEWSISPIRNSGRRVWNNQRPCMVSCGGTLYWTTPFHTCLFTLDVSNAGYPLRCRRIRLPVATLDTTFRDTWKVQLGLCNGKIHLSLMLYDGKVAYHGSILSIWKLIEEGHGAYYRWIRVAMDVLDFSFASVGMVKFDPLDEDIVYIVLDEKKQVFRFNLKNKTMTKMDCDDRIENCVTFVLPYWPLLTAESQIARLRNGIIWGAAIDGRQVQYEYD